MNNNIISVFNGTVINNSLDKPLRNKHVYLSRINLTHPVIQLLNCVIDKFKYYRCYYTGMLPFQCLILYFCISLNCLQLSENQLAEFLELCQGDETWATNILLDSNKLNLPKPKRSLNSKVLAIPDSIRKCDFVQ